jgi:signal transduction histidine kinase
MSTPFHQRLYLRIWLAVVAAVAVLTLVAGWLARMEAEQERAQRPGREIVVRNQAGEIIGQDRVRPNRVPGQGPEFQITLRDGTTLFIQLPRPIRPLGAGGGAGGQAAPGAVRLPFSLAWLLGLVGLAVAVGTYPIVRRLTKRLETVQQGVERWGTGDLSTRLSEQGSDEVAFLATRFNHAAERIEALLTTQKTLLESQKTLLASQKSLLANASHELRSPLTRIRMGLELMRDVAPTHVASRTALPPVGANFSRGGPVFSKSGEAKNSVDSSEAWPALKDEISRNIAELDQLIEEILLASRLDAREADLGTVEAVDLIGLAAEECARVHADLDAQLAPPGSGTFAEEATAATELVVQGVSKLLRRALRNLLENARRYGAGDITVSLRRAGDQAVIKVCDHGPGVPPALRERIFEPFYRLPGATERDGGVGLGLALVKSIAIRHGGSVTCEPHTPGGACFVIRLPLGLQKVTTFDRKT